MCRNISNMLCALFAVVLGLPASLEAKSGIPDCRSNLYASGCIYCQLSGYDNFTDLNIGTCEVVCGGPKVQLPKEACSNVVHSPCSEELARTLTRWNADMTKRKHDLIKNW
uniref:Putative ixodes 10 kDa peptide protein n=1 Tax=Ixodes ricinus TaxID=34613 RepID=A0A0K8R586_IXORI